MEELKPCDLLQTVDENLGYILRDIGERDKVFLYVKNAQFALSQYRRAAQENDYAALKAQYDEINRYNISCTKKIDELLAEKLDTDAHLKAISDSLSEQLRRAAPENKALTCDGCEYKGKYEREYEYGYPSPCTACQRRTADNYARRPEDATSEG